MQDNNRYNELANKGWDKMSQILDKEMPVKKRKVRFGFIIILLALASIVGGIGYSGYFQDLQTTPKANPKVPADSSIIANSIDSEAKEPTSIVSLNNPEEERRIEVNSEGIPKDRSNIGPQSDSKLKDTDTEVRQVNQIAESDSMGEIFETNTPVTKSSSNTKNENQDLIESFKEKNLAAAAIDDVITDDNIHQFGQLAEISYLDPLKLAVIDNVERHIDNNKNFKLIKNPKALSLYVEAAYIFPVKSYTYGPSLGIGLAKEISRKLSFEAGLRFAMLQYNDDFTSLNRSEFLDAGAGPELSDPTYVPDVVNTSEDLFTQDNQVKSEYFDFVSGKIQNLRYLGIPLGIRYKIQRRHQIGIGMTYDYLIGASNQKIFGVSANSELSLSNDLDSNAFFKYNIFTRHNFLVSGSYSYQIARRFKLYSHFNHSLNSVIKTENKTAMNKRTQLAIGLRYQLDM